MTAQNATPAEQFKQHLQIYLAQGICPDAAIYLATERLKKETGLDYMHSLEYSELTSVDKWYPAPIVELAEYFGADVDKMCRTLFMAGLLKIGKDGEFKRTRFGKAVSKKDSDGLITWNLYFIESLVEELKIPQ
jgi:hypothetical protein